jgi:hypothetical protein
MGLGRARIKLMPRFLSMPPPVPTKLVDVPTSEASSPPAVAIVASPARPPITILMPDLGALEPSGGAKVTRFLKKVGEVVTPTEVLCEIETGMLVLRRNILLSRLTLISI